ncbi:hypothetical protein QLX08_007900 [Tetragonisca angustula]|uniref:Uncharacterized protein n=1 Tax=Tetragonisca angustula TaxID=166442 RepID=A0AAW0ZMW1_9HYME
MAAELLAELGCVERLSSHRSNEVVFKQALRQLFRTTRIRTSMEFVGDSVNIRAAAYNFHRAKESPWRCADPQGGRWRVNLDSASGVVLFQSFEQQTAALTWFPAS